MRFICLGFVHSIPLPYSLSFSLSLFFSITHSHSHLFLTPSFPLTFTFHLTFQFFPIKTNTYHRAHAHMQNTSINTQHTQRTYHRLIKFANKIALTKFVFYDANLHICRNSMGRRGRWSVAEISWKWQRTVRMAEIKIMGNLKSNTNKMSETKCVCAHIRTLWLNLMVLIFFGIFEGALPLLIFIYMLFCWANYFVCVCVCKCVFSTNIFYFVFFSCPVRVLSQLKRLIHIISLMRIAK